MPEIMEFFLNMVLVVGLQITVYILFLRQKILTWGTAKDEVNMPLAGDDLAPGISATRAISINAPISDVWKWIIQLGADRGGFFSYSFLEKALGYEQREAEPVPEFQEMQVGRIIPASVDESKSLIKFHFPVAAVEPGKSFVLENWGSFVLKEINSKQTRLIVRTHQPQLPNLKSKIVDFILTPLHYIMERRMLMGFKARAESGAGVRLPETSDNLWLLGILLSGIGIVLIIFVGQGIQNILLSSIYGIIWIWAFLILEPRPKYSLTLLLMEVITIIMSAALAGK